MLEPKEESVEGQTVEPTTEAENVEEAPEQEATAITVEVDGKMVTLTPAQVAEAYKSGLRQDDYSRKTMEVAETRKAAVAERNAYAERLNAQAYQLQGALQEQSQINWNELLENDPVEYLKQQHLSQQRQAMLQQSTQELQFIQQLNQQEQQQAYSSYIQAQQQDLLAKLPAWKDEAKAKADKAEMREFLLSEGFTNEDISQVADYRHVLLVKDAMAFRKLLKQAPDATKRVQSAPARVERSGNGQNNTQTDAHKNAMSRLRKSGSIEDATAVFANLI